MSNSQLEGIDRMLYNHHWDFPIHKKIIPMLTCPISTIRWFSPTRNTIPLTITIQSTSSYGNIITGGNTVREEGQAITKRCALCVDTCDSYTPAYLSCQMCRCDSCGDTDSCSHVTTRINVCSLLADLGGMNVM